MPTRSRGCGPRVVLPQVDAMSLVGEELIRSDLDELVPLVAKAPPAPATRSSRPDGRREDGWSRGGAFTAARASRRSRCGPSGSVVLKAYEESIK